MNTFRVHSQHFSSGLCSVVTERHTFRVSLVADRFLLADYLNTSRYRYSQMYPTGDISENKYSL